MRWLVTITRTGQSDRVCVECLEGIATICTVADGCNVSFVAWCIRSNASSGDILDFMESRVDPARREPDSPTSDTSVPVAALLCKQAHIKNNISKG